MSNIVKDITGGQGTKCLGPSQTIDGVDVAAIYVREDCPNLVITRERFPGETTDTNVTADHFVNTTPKAGDLIRGFGYTFKKIVTGSTGSVTLIYNK
jgi:hypothetical protein